MADITMQDVLTFIDGMSVLQLNEMVNALKEKYGVSAAMPMAAPAAAAAAPAAAVEQTEFKVMLINSGDKKIQVIKEVRAITGLGLKEAKALVDGTPAVVKEGVSKEEAADIKAKIEASGGIVEIK